MHLLILDSSREEIAEQNAALVDEYGPSVRHMIFPETEQVGVKLYKGLLHVQTATASFCADDDLVFPQGLSDAIRFLAGHPDYVCAHGLYLNFRLGDEYKNGMEDVHVWREYGGPSNGATHPGARIFRLFQNYESLFYGVFRTQDLQHIFAGVAAIPTLHYQELFQSVAAVIKGRVHRFPRLYAARQSCDPAEPERDKWQTFYWFAEDIPELLEHYRAYREELWRFYEAYSAAPKLDKAAFLKTLDLSHAVYFAKRCPVDYLHSVLQPYWPEEGYTQPDQVDIFPQIAPAAISTTSAAAPPKPARWTLRWYPLAVRYVLQSAQAAPYIARMNWRVRNACRTAWKCKLRWGVRWLASVPEFRSTYFELCQYLDGPERKEHAGRK